MFHFEGSWIDLVYTLFFAIGCMVTILFVFILVVAVVIGKVEQRKAKKEVQKTIDALDPEKRRQQILDSKKDLEFKIARLEKQLEAQAAYREEKKEDGAKKED